MKCKVCNNEISNDFQLVCDSCIKREEDYLTEEAIKELEGAKEQ